MVGAPLCTNGQGTNGQVVFQTTLDFVHRTGMITSSLTFIAPMQAKAHSALRVTGAALFCAALAAVLSLSFQHQDLEVRSKLPLVFLLVILLVSRKIGEAAAITGTIAAALVFAMLLFQPLGGVGIAAKPARLSLAWFLLGGMVCAHLLSPHSGKPSRRESDFSHHGQE